MGMEFDGRNRFSRASECQGGRIQTGQEELKGVLPYCKGFVEGEGNVEPSVSNSKVSTSENQSPQEENAIHQNWFVGTINKIYGVIGNTFDVIGNAFLNAANWFINKSIEMEYGPYEDR